MVAKGMSLKSAKMHAAKIYNASHPEMPMSPAHPEGMKKAIRGKVMSKLAGSDNDDRTENL